MEITDKDIENLKIDFYRFAHLHSWYKHLPIECKTFVFFKSDEQQVRYEFDKCLTNETRDYWWHFIDPCDIKYLQKLKEKGTTFYQIKLGAFFRGLEKYGHQRSYGLVSMRNHNTNEYIRKKYGHLQNINKLETNDNKELLDEIVVLEQTEYLNSALQFIVYSV